MTIRYHLKNTEIPSLYFSVSISLTTQTIGSIIKMWHLLRSSQSDACCHQPNLSLTRALWKHYIHILLCISHNPLTREQSDALAAQINYNAQNTHAVHKSQCATRGEHKRVKTRARSTKSSREWLLGLVLRIMRTARSLAEK